MFRLRPGLFSSNRLDFDNFVLATPPGTAGVCDTIDRLVTVSPTLSNPPVICGTNAGQHSKTIISF